MARVLPAQPGGVGFVPCRRVAWHGTHCRGPQRLPMRGAPRMGAAALARRWPPRPDKPNVVILPVVRYCRFLPQSHRPPSGWHRPARSGDAGFIVVSVTISRETPSLPHDAGANGAGVSRRSALRSRSSRRTARSMATEAERQTKTYSNRLAAQILRQHQYKAQCDSATRSPPPRSCGRSAAEAGRHPMMPVPLGRRDSMHGHARFAVWRWLYALPMVEMRRLAALLTMRSHCGERTSVM